MESSCLRVQVGRPWGVNRARFGRLGRFESAEATRLAGLGRLRWPEPTLGDCPGRPKWPEAASGDRFGSILVPETVVLGVVLGYRSVPCCECAKPHETPCLCSEIKVRGLPQSMKIRQKSIVFCVRQASALEVASETALQGPNLLLGRYWATPGTSRWSQ